MAIVSIALAFLGEPSDPAAHVNHLNGEKADNRPANLEWTTLAGNVAHAHATGLMTQYGERHDRAKLTRHAVVAARSAFAAGEPVSALAARYGVARATMHAAVHGLSWKSV